jgi:VanZ family protein
VKWIFSRSFIIYQLPLYFYVVVIFVLSSIPPDSMPDIDTVWDFDKAVHFVEYAILGFLLFRALLSSGRVSARWSGVLAICCAIALGGIDELYQSLPGRNTSVYDWISDSLGAMVAIICCLALYEKVRENLRARRSRNFSS